MLGPFTCYVTDRSELQSLTCCVSAHDHLKVFEELLLDADWSLNAGNWQWLSASAFFHQYFRVYSPIAFGKKTDKYGDYIKLVLFFIFC